MICGMGGIGGGGGPASVELIVRRRRTKLNKNGRKHIRVIMTYLFRKSNRIKFNHFFRSKIIKNLLKGNQVFDGYNLTGIYETQSLG
jgi:hypothetical protein